MDSFYFADLFAFLQTTLGMVLSFLAGWHTKKRKEKSRPSGKAKRLNATKK